MLISAKTQQFKAHERKGRKICEPNKGALEKKIFRG
jgi:hypothetical protein